MQTATKKYGEMPVMLSLSQRIGHHWTKEELHDECMAIDESQRDFHQMIDVALMNVALENSRMQAEAGQLFTQEESRKMRHDFVVKHKG